MNTKNGEKICLTFEEVQLGWKPWYAPEAKTKKVYVNSTMAQFSDGHTILRHFKDYNTNDLIFDSEYLQRHISPEVRFPL